MSSSKIRCLVLSKEEYNKHELTGLLITAIRSQESS